MQLPTAFVSSLEQLLGAEASACADALAQPPVTSIRLNPRKVAGTATGEEPVSWYARGRYLPERPLFVADPLFHAGAYYVQEASSMFTGLAFRTVKKAFETPVRVLDLCAAPGGKSTLLLDEMDDEDLLVSNEIIKSRVGVLEENLVRWGRANVAITHNDPQQFAGLGSYFDIMLVDAPCSGEGMFRKDRKAVEEWSGSHTVFCAARQKRILQDVLPALRPGGFLLYSTCTFNTKENEEVLLPLLREGYVPVRIPVNDTWGITEVEAFENETLYAYRFYPHRVKGEGFFMACLQKPGQSEPLNLKEVRTPRLKEQDLAVLHPWIDHPQRFRITAHRNGIGAIPESLLPDLEYLKSRLQVRLAGLRVGELIKGSLVPDHQLAMSVYRNPGIPAIETDRVEALKFLKKEPFFITGYEPGIYLVTHKQQALGWVKALPGRFNNYLPVHLRILKDLNQLI